MTTAERIQILAECADLFEEFTGPFDASTLTQWMAAELGTPDALEQPRPHGPRLQTIARAPAHLLHVVSANTPHAAFQSLLRGLLIGSNNFVKLPTSGLPVIERAVEAMPEALRGAVRCAQDLPEDWRSWAELVVVFGSDRTLQWFAGEVPPGVRFIGHGQRLSIALVSGEATEGGRLAARDVSLFDQQGCLSVHDVYVHPDCSCNAREFASILAEQMRIFNEGHPRGPLSPSEAGAITTLRETVRFMAASKPDEVAMWESSFGTDWTVIFETDPTLKISPLHRVVFVKPWPTNSPANSLGSATSYLSSLALHPWDSEFARSLTGLGAARICPLGETQQPSLFWHHDGLPPLAGLVTWIDLG